MHINQWVPKVIALVFYLVVLIITKAKECLLINIKVNII